ncbi:N-acetylmuramic acid 6-phosphate phosphatase MupP [Maricurvus nonylphenolicus]|uniref:HAD family hydrolase n=1 Tax=Maricurvus nonylphenolicus TaxID=1008307 RepID=UPI0036F31C3B
MAVKAVLFDLDGTLIDTAPDFIVVLNRLLEEEGRRPLPEQPIRDTVSSGAKALVKLGFKLEESDSEFERLRLRLLELYSDHLAVYSKPFNGIELLLEQLTKHKLHWGIATNKPEVYTTPLLQQLQLSPASVICPDHVQERKPHPESLLLAGKQLNCSPTEMIYIGDHQRDIECGRRAGAITITARYGYIEENDNPDHWQADHIVDCANELWPIIKTYL